jgi:hypothetical protein
MANKSSQILELYATGSWKRLNEIGKKLNNDNRHFTPAQVLLLRCICESPLEANYSPELIDSLKEENSIAALGLTISRASIAHAIAKLVMQDMSAAKEFIQSSLSVLISTIDLVGLRISKKEKQTILSGASNLINCLHSQLELEQTLLQNKLSRNLTFVLGMHRSGTSALTGMLVQAGFSAPKGLMPANSHNPKGYWESKGIMKTNDLLLESFNSLWSTTANLPINWAYTEQGRMWRESLLNCFKEDFDNSDHPIIKDPRFCILIEGLKPWLESELIHINFVVIIRDPCEVVQSLKKAQNISISRGFLLWISYNLKAIIETHGYPKKIIDYHFLLENPSITLDYYTEILSLNPSNRTSSLDPIDFIEASLCNENPINIANEMIANNDENIEALQELAKKIYNTIIQAPSDQVLLEESLKKLEKIFLATSI